MTSQTVMYLSELHAFYQSGQKGQFRKRRHRQQGTIKLNLPQLRIELTVSLFSLHSTIQDRTRGNPAMTEWLCITTTVHLGVILAVIET